jgi:hypothetical protein
MSIKYGTPGFAYYKDTNGRVYGVRDYWYTKTDNRDYLTITVMNDNRSGRVNFSILEYRGYEPKYMARIAQEKADELNARDKCVLSIPVTVC